MKFSDFCLLLEKIPTNRINLDKFIQTPYVNGNSDKQFIHTISKFSITDWQRACLWANYCGIECELIDKANFKRLEKTYGYEAIPTVSHKETINSLILSLDASEHIYKGQNIYIQPENNLILLKIE